MFATCSSIYRQSLVKIPPAKILQVIIPFIFLTLFHATHNNPGYRKNRAKIHSSFENKQELNTRHEGCTFSANKKREREGSENNQFNTKTKCEEVLLFDVSSIIF